MGIKIRKKPQGPGLRTKNMKIGEVERRTGLAVSAVRFYEDQGLLTPKRSKKGTRLYGEADIAHLDTLRQLTDLGVPIETLHTLYNVKASSGTGDEAAHKSIYHLTRLRADLKSKRDAIDRAMSRLESLEEDVRPCFRCKEKPTPAACRSCENKPSPI